MTDLFNSETLPVVDPEKDYLPELVGDDKKYKTPQALARAAMEKDLFIERLKRENAGVRQELAQRSSMEDMLAKIDERTRVTAQPPVQPVERPPNHGDEGTRPALDETAIETRLTQLLDKKEQQRREDSNASIVEDRLRKAYGEDYQSLVKQQASKLGVGTAFLSDLARKQPQAFFKLLGLDERPESSVNPPVTTFRPTGGSHADKTFYGYYEPLRLKDPTAYWKPAVQNEMQKQLTEMGQEEFYKR